MWIGPSSKLLLPFINRSPVGVVFGWRRQRMCLELKVKSATLVCMCRIFFYYDLVNVFNKKTNKHTNRA